MAKVLTKIMIKIFIDVGHGGSDPGASGYGLKEKDLTLKISKKIAAILKSYNVDVKLSRTTDKTLSLTQRTAMANKWGADYLLSVHINAGGGTGYEDFIYNGAVSKKTAELRDVIHSEIVKELHTVRNRGKKKANFHMVRESKMPAMLSENLFIDTKADATLLGTDSYLDKIALGHANGLIKAFGLSKGADKPSKPTVKPPKKETGSTTVSKPKVNLTVDGKWGNSTSRALQKYLKTTQDGFLSGQLRNDVTNSLYGDTVKYGTGGSMVIKALQKLIGAKIDGLLGPATVKALQKYLITTQDGKLSKPSLVVKAMQRALNAGVL